jgi:CheY-like chemotaxis protein
MSADFTPKTLLLVDDAATNRKMLRKLLELRNHNCEEAEDGLVGVSMVKAAGLDYYDAILMDFVMPNMNGPAATQAIRALGYTGLIIGVTGNALTEDKSTFLQAGATEVLLKPLKMKTLQKYIDL